MARRLKTYCRKRLWIRSFGKAGCRIDPGTEFTGQVNPFAQIQLQRSVTLDRDITIWISDYPGADASLSFGERVYVGRNVYIGVHAPISIGSHAMIGAYCYLISGNHAFESREVPMQDQGFVGAPIIIESDVWIGTHVVVLPGVSIARGAIVAAGSMVNRDVGEYEIWGGIPARFIKMRP